MYKICHQSGRVLFTTDNEVTARNREQFGWKVTENQPEGVSMTRKEVVMNKIKSNGGWPFGVRHVEVDCDCRVFFDGICMRGFIDKQQINEFMWNNVLIRESDYNMWKSNQRQE